MGHLRLVSCEWGSASASLRMPDMSSPNVVRLLSSRFRVVIWVLSSTAAMALQASA